MELYLRVRQACATGMSQRQAAKEFNISRDTVAKMMMFSVPPGYRRTADVKRPKLDPFIPIIEEWLEVDRLMPRKQRHTAKRVFDRLREECGFTGGYTIIKDYIRERERRGQEVPSRQQSRQKGRLTPLENRNARLTPPLGLRPHGGLSRAQGWPTFTPPRGRFLRRR